jgi:hypothetical protein
MAFVAQRARLVSARLMLINCVAGCRDGGSALRTRGARPLLHRSSLMESVRRSLRLAPAAWSIGTGGAIANVQMNDATSQAPKPRDRMSHLLRRGGLLGCYRISAACFAFITRASGPFSVGAIRLQGYFTPSC